MAGQPWLSAQRPVSRIPEVLAEIEKLWRMFPDMRLGQLIVNLAGRDPFFIEDDDLKERARRYPKQGLME